MNKNIKQVLIIILSLVLGLIIYKLLKALIFAIILGVAIFIGYNIVNGVLSKKENEHKQG